MIKKLLFFVVFAVLLQAEIATVSAPAIFLDRYDEYKWQSRIGNALSSYRSDGTNLFGYGVGFNAQRRIDSSYFYGFGAKVLLANGSDKTHEISSQNIPLEIIFGRRFVANEQISWALIAGAVYRYSQTIYDGKRSDADYIIRSNATGAKVGVISRLDLMQNIALEPYYTLVYEQISKKSNSAKERSVHTYGADLLFKHIAVGAMATHTKDESDLMMIRVILRF